MRSKTSHKKHKQRVYNMRGCSSSSCNKKNKRTNQNKKKTQKKMSWKGGCGDGVCPMTNHSMIGGYLRRGDSSSLKKKRTSRRSSARKRSSNHSSHVSHDDSEASEMSEMRGGNIFSDVIRGVAYNGGVINNALKGYPPPVSPSPYADQFRSTFSKI